MPVEPSLAGRTLVGAPYAVSREKISEFARAIGATVPDESAAGDGVGDAPFSFPMVVAFELMGRLLADPAVGIELRNVVHRDERIEQIRPLRAGDVVVGTLTVDSVRAAAGVDLVTTRTDIATLDGEGLCTAVATLAHRAVG